MDAFGKLMDRQAQKQRGEIVGWCPWCLETQALGEVEQPHQPGCPGDPALMKRLDRVRLKGARPS